MLAWALVWGLLWTLLPRSTAHAAGSVSLSVASVSLGYSQPVAVAAIGIGTDFVVGGTNVTLLTADATPLNVISSVTVQSATRVDFVVAPGLAAGGYLVRLSWPNGQLETPFQVTGAPSATVAPAEVAAGYGQPFTVTVKGTNTHFVAGQTAVTVRDANNAATGKASGVNVIDKTNLTFTVGTGLVAGNYTVRIVTGGETVAVPFVLTGPATGAAAPAQLSAGYLQPVTVTLTGTNTHFAPGQTSVAILDSTDTPTGKAGSVSVVSPTRLTFSVATGLAAGNYRIRVVTGVEVLPLIPFTVTPQPTAVAAPIEVSEGYFQPFSVTLTGTGTSFADGQTLVSVLDSKGTPTGAVSGVTVANGTKLTFTVATGLTHGTYSVRATTGHQQVSTPFTVLPPATATASPAGTAAGYGPTTVTVTGVNTHWADGLTTVDLRTKAGASTGKVAALSVADPGRLTFSLLSGLAEGNYDLRITTGVERVTIPFGVQAGATMSLSPAGLASGHVTAVTATGIGTKFTLNPTVSVLNSADEPQPVVSGVAAASDTTVRFTVSGSLPVGSYTVRIQAGGLTTTAPLTVAVDNVPPAITFTSPAADSWHKSGAVAVSATVTDNYAQVADGAPLTVTYDGKPVAHTLQYQEATGKIVGNVTIPADVADGQHDLQIGVRDRGNNLGTGTISIGVDNTGPSINITSPKTTDWTRPGAVITVAATVTDAHAGLPAQAALTVTVGEKSVQGLTYTRTSATAATITGDLTVPSGLTDGQNALSITLADALGNTGNGTLTIGVDSQAPSWTAGKLTASSIGTDRLTLHWSGATDNVGVTQYRVLRASTVVATVAKTNTTVTGLAADTEYTFTVEALDAAGNLSTTGPSLTIKTARSGGGGGGGDGPIDPPKPDETPTTPPTTPPDTPTTPADEPTTDQGDGVTIEQGADGTLMITVPESLPAETDDVVIDTGTVRFSIPAAVLQAAGGRVQISVQAVDLDQPASNPADEAIRQAALGAQQQGYVPASQVFRLTMTVVDPATGASSGVTSFTHSVTVQIPYHTAQNPRHLGVYRLNPGTGAWEFRGGKADPAAGVVTVQLDGFSEYAVMAYSRTFADVDTHWAKVDIELMASRHVARGTSDTTFTPEGNVTRAEFAALLVRSLGLKPHAGTGATFADVQSTDWFFAEVEAAARAGLITGFEGQFRPHDQVTREELAVMLIRALKLRGDQSSLTAAQVSQRLAAFQDSAAIASWAREAAAQAVTAGLINGRTPTTFVPEANATRAEAVVLLKRLLERLGDL